MEQLADRSVYRCHLPQQTSGGQVLEEQSDDRKNNKYNLQTSQVSQSEKKSKRIQDQLLQFSLYTFIFGLQR